jgi:hypothetical protein
MQAANAFDAAGAGGFGGFGGGEGTGIGGGRVDGGGLDGEAQAKVWETAGYWLRR